MLVVTILMGCIATFDMCLTFAINLNAFVLYDGPGGPKAAFDNTSGWMDVMGVRNSPQILALVLISVSTDGRCDPTGESLFHLDSELVFADLSIFSDGLGRYYAHIQMLDRLRSILDSDRCPCNPGHRGARLHRFDDISRGNPPGRLAICKPV
jgi:hypothetical protein